VRRVYGFGGIDTVLKNDAPNIKIILARLTDLENLDIAGAAKRATVDYLKNVLTETLTRLKVSD